MPQPRHMRAIGATARQGAAGASHTSATEPCDDSRQHHHPAQPPRQDCTSLASSLPCGPGEHRCHRAPRLAQQHCHSWGCAMWFHLKLGVWRLRQQGESSLFWPGNWACLGYKHEISPCNIFVSVFWNPSPSDIKTSFIISQAKLHPLANYPHQRRTQVVQLQDKLSLFCPLVGGILVLWNEQRTPCRNSSSLGFYTRQINYLRNYIILEAPNENTLCCHLSFHENYKLNNREYLISACLKLNFLLM